MAETKQVLVPDIGDFKDVPVIELLVKPGDTVRMEDPLISLESDKATIEVPSPLDGVIKEISVKLGDRVSQGSLILTVEVSTTIHASSSSATETRTPSITPAPVPTSLETTSISTPAPIRQPPPVPTLTTDAGTFNKAHAGPSVRRFARELGANLALVRGSGLKQRILREDVQSYIKNELSKPRGGGADLNLLPWPQVNFAKFGPVESRPLSRIKKMAGANLHRNWVMIPHVTQFDEADITEIESLRKQSNEASGGSGGKATLLAFLMQVTTAALKKFPEFNASLDQSGDEMNLVIKNYYHLGFAADTPNGLVVPVIRDVDQKNVLKIAEELGQLSSLAREGKLKPTEMQGASFTISSLGGLGGTAFTPIINAPEVAILGISRASIKPVYRDGQFVPRLILPISLSYDHRVIDGASAARFTTYLSELLSDTDRVRL
ncbi:acetyltransferase component of pyruvate dehydrogenase complex [Nitrosomonadaceae bacterium]|nr:dihydrolipoyllysine-residue acetyltransferase [Nitrosomonadaceae bacterium]GDX59841.1 acetyltransferase component of pyruvate dehydrogenase complex [Nitrosomonadaceae bacterium]